MRITPLLSLVLLTACGLEPIGGQKVDTADSGAPGGQTGVQITESLDFGSVGVGQSVTDTVVIRNFTEDNFVVLAGDIEGDAAFYFDTSTGFPASTPADGGETVLTIGFTPTSEVNYSGEVLLTVQGSADPVSIPLTGIGGSGSGTGGDDGGGDDGSDDGLTTDLNSIDFGDVYTTATDFVPLQIINNGTYDVLVGGLTFSNPNVFEWTAGSGSSVNLPQVIAGGSSKTINVAFSPSEERAYSETLTIESDYGNKVVQLVGVGTEPPCIVCDPTIGVTTNTSDSTVFALSGVFGIPATGTLVIRNESDVNLELYDFNVINDSQGGTYTISGFTPQTLAPRAQTSGTITHTCPELCFELSLFGTNVLNITSNATNYPTYEVKLQSIGP